MPKSDGARQCRAISIYIISALIYIVVFFHRLVAASIGEEFQDKFSASSNVSKEMMLPIFGSLYFYFYAFLQPFVGITVDAIKPRWTIFMAGIFMTAGSLIIAFPKNLSIVYFGRSLVGIGAAFVYVPILKLIALWFPIHKFGLLTGIMVALGGLGGFFCTAPLTILIQAIAKNPNAKALILDYVFSIVGGITALLTIVFVCVAHDTPEKAGYAPIVNPSTNKSEQSGVTSTDPPLQQNVMSAAGPTVAEGSLVSSGIVNAPDSTHDFYCNTTVPTFEVVESTVRSDPATSSLVKKSHLTEFCDSMKTVFCSENSKYLILMMVAYFFCTGSYFTISATAGVELITNTVNQNGGNVKLDATWVQAGLNLGTIVGSPLQSVLANLMGRKPMQLINNGIMFLVYLGVAIVKLVNPAIWGYAILYVLIGLIGGTMIVVAYTNVKEMFPIAVSGTAIGFFNIAPFLGAAVFQNVSPELIKLNGGKSYENMCYLLAVNTVVAALVLIFSKETSPVKSRKQKKA
ncbi:Major facilitator family transporter [Giardia lamblia P15]|uniref:Lysosomal dipeptide transporter MFSD1 n=1 Tax=Giardia intestinalis (strain P15) TaxID=658858 RepID=E1F4V7_GIAIA|nr:Major facilitator family transporter [Giardia lamblia P15]